MPFFGLSYDRDVEHANGVSNYDFIRIIECPAADDVIDAEVALRKELQAFIDDWTAIRTGAASAVQTAEWKALVTQLNQVTAQTKEDVAFLTDDQRRVYEADRLVETDAMRAKLEELRLSMNEIEEKAKKAFHTGLTRCEEYNEDGPNHVWYGSKLHDYPGWRCIPGFGPLRYDHLLGSVSQLARTQSLEMPSFTILSADLALSKLSNKDSGIDIY